MEETAIAFSDWEAVRLSFRLKREDRKKKKEEREETTVIEKAGPDIVPDFKKTDIPKAVPKETGDFAEPWPGQHLAFDLKVIREKGYVRSVRTTLSGVQGYTFYKEDGTGQFLRPEMLVIQKMAHK